MPLPHEIGGLIRYLAHDDVPMATDGDDISIRSTEEMDKYESLRQWEFGHTRVYDVNLLERVGMGSDDLSNGWMTLQPCKRKCKHRLTHRPAWCMTSSVTSRLTLVLESCKDLILGRCRVPRYESSLVLFHSKIFQLSCQLSCLLVISLPLPRLLVSIASIS
jgi:hypothetical protein